MVRPKSPVFWPEVGVVPVGVCFSKRRISLGTSDPASFNALYKAFAARASRVLGDILLIMVLVKSVTAPVAPTNNRPGLNNPPATSAAIRLPLSPG